MCPRNAPRELESEAILRMKRILYYLPPIFALLALLAGYALRLAATSARAADDKRPYGIERRVPWTTSRIKGSPEPPPPYRIERVFPKLTFKNPLLITAAPGTDQLFIGEQAGKLFSFHPSPDCPRADLFLDLTQELHNWDKSRVKGVGALYGLTFHPQFVKNRYCYICYVLDSKKDGEQLPDGSRVSRFRVTETDPPRVDPASEQVLLTFLAGGHNGGDLHFGPDGFLYISTGDGTDPNPPDKFDTGQDISDLLSSVLRIDVDHADAGKAYAVPRDNPFVGMPGARPEVWAYGFRNPWRMGFDRLTGDLWVGDVGWELWEMVYHVRRGGNYGWSVMEGPQQVRPDSKRGPTPILPPALAFPHSEAASITCGYVYRGKRFPELVGAYICGDWMSRKIWGTRFGKDDRILSHQVLAEGKQRIVAFGEDHDGELYFLAYDDNGTIHQLARNQANAKTSAAFPRKLSETGLFASVKDQQPAPGVVPFSINAEQWNDHATARRWVALPGESTVRIYDAEIRVPDTPYFKGTLFFPQDGVLVKTLWLEMERGKPQSRRPIETQILHYDDGDWHAYTYQWKEDQTDATLVPGGGAERTFAVVDPQAPGGHRKQTWRFQSRTECVHCHNGWAGVTLAFNELQLRRPHDYGSVVDDQMRTLTHIGIVTLVKAPESKEPPEHKPLPPSAHLTDPYDRTADIGERARSYLHVNCSHCHQFGAGGTALIELRYSFPLEETKAFDVRPVQGTFDLTDGRIIAPGDPYRSVLYYRMSKLGRGRMPHIGSDIVDDRGARLIHDWIMQLSPHREEQALIARLRTLDERSAGAGERQHALPQEQKLAQAVAQTSGPQNIIPEERQKAELEQRARERLQARTAERAETIQKLLSSTTGALLLLHAVEEGAYSDPLRAQIVAASQTRAEPQVRDLFERFIPDEQRVPRLGTLIKADQLLKLKGDAARGKELFLKSTTLQCINCHRVGTTGSTLGPDLTQIGKKYTRAQILENILEPSKTIDPKYATYIAETVDGQMHTGILAEKTATEVVLRNIGDKEIRIPAAKVERLVTQKTSIMPEQLLRDLTAEQAADLLEYLSSLK
jgi:putative heme-binding domain-containing protein